MIPDIILLNTLTKITWSSLNIALLDYTVISYVNRDSLLEQSKPNSKFKHPKNTTWFMSAPDLFSHVHNKCMYHILICIYRPRLFIVWV